MMTIFPHTHYNQTEHENERHDSSDSNVINSTAIQFYYIIVKKEKKTMNTNGNHGKIFVGASARTAYSLPLKVGPGHDKRRFLIFFQGA